MNEREDQAGIPEVDDTAARVLSVLLITPADDLEGFRRRLLGKDSEVDLEVLEAALELLATVGKALLSSNEALWQRVLAAREAIRQAPEAPREESVEPEPPTEVAAAAASVAKPSLEAPPTPPRPAPVAVPRPPSAASPWAKQPEPAAPKSEPDPMSHTQALGDLPEGPALPFRGKAKPPSPTAPGLEPLPEQALHGTVAGSAQSPIAGQALPFRQPGAASQPSSPASVEGQVEPTVRIRLDRAPASTPATELSDDEPTRVATTLAAAGADAGATTVEITLEDYAVLCAECAAFPERVAATRAKYKIPDEQAHRHVDQLWQARLAVNAELKQKWQELFDGFRAFLEREKSK